MAALGADLQLAQEKDKKVRMVRFDFNAIADIEEAAGMGIRQLFTKEMSFSILRLMLCHGLRHQTPGMTLQAAGLLIQEHKKAGGKRKEIGEAIGQAVTLSGIFAGEDDDEEKKPGPAEGTTGAPTPPTTDAS